MDPQELRFRQVHLDFHTAEQIEGIGADFDPDEFADTLARAHVDSVTCFARCHHGWVYYDTKGYPERRHPHLTRNLLAEQIDACHRRGIRVPIYITVQWDHFTAERHADWLVVSDRGCIGSDHPDYRVYAPGFYRFLCVNSPYRDWLKGFVREVLETLPTDGIFFDIVQVKDCSCRHCRSKMLAEGLDPSDPAARWAYQRRVTNEFALEMSEFIRSIDPSCGIFYNSSHVTPRHRQWLAAFSHLELESLPSGGWGYMHFPLTMRYARTLGVDCLGMTGKFHTSWGDFQSFKNPAALQFECFQMLALNAKCSIGDQLHPTGRICEHTYDLIGAVYAEVERKEPFCRAAVPLADVGVLTSEAAGKSVYEGGELSLPDALLGATRMLQEARHQFDVIDPEADFSAYRALILPDYLPVDEPLAAALHDYLAGGGAVIASCRAGLRPDGGDFALPDLGVRAKGEARYSPDFLVPAGELAEGLRPTEHVMYLRGMEVAPAMDAQVLAGVHVPYFNRTWDHFCSHRHTPSSGKGGYPGVVRRGRCVYFAHPIFTQYARNAARWCRQLLVNAIGLLLPEPLVRLDAPSTALATINDQPGEGRWVLHLLHYIPERRGRDFDTIEDVIPLHDVSVSVRADREIQSVRLVPDGDALDFAAADGRVSFTVPTIAGHQMVELEY